jgi:hypothetical protein
MKRFNFSALAVIILLSINGFAKCPMGTVKMSGTVKGFSDDNTKAEVQVILETNKGVVSKAASLSNGKFAVDLSFGTQSSYFPLWGHRCKRVPKLVRLKVVDGSHVLAERALKFKEAFELQGAYVYELKEALVLDAGRTR